MPDFHTSFQHVYVTHHLRPIGPGDVQDTRLNAGGHNDFIKRHQVFCCGAFPQLDLDPQVLQLGLEVADGLVEFKLSRNLLSQKKLPSKGLVGFEQHHFCTETGALQCRTHARRSTAHHGHALS